MLDGVCYIHLSPKYTPKCSKETSPSKQPYQYKKKFRTNLLSTVNVVTDMLQERPLLMLCLRLSEKEDLRVTLAKNAKVPPPTKKPILVRRVVAAR